MANTYELNLIKIGGSYLNYRVGGGGAETPYERGLHLTCDAHFQTWLSYSSQKSYVKIWFRLVEIRGMLIFRGGAEEPLLGGLLATCNAHLRTCPSYFSRKSCVKIWLGLVEPFKSYRGNRQKKNHIRN